MTAIVDYDAGNIRSVEKALRYLGEEPILTSDPEKLLKADRVILPGDGNFGDASEELRKNGMDEVIREIVAKGTPFLGICVGLQVLFEESEESPGVKGLGLLKGKILRIPAADGLKVPQIGWNSVRIAPEARLFQGVEDESFFYFVHSYYLPAETPGVVAACEYGVSIGASVECGNIYACQFHPEKSSPAGLTVLKNFLSLR